MIFVGFGFLMTFLRHYSYSAVGFNFFASCLVMLEAILALGFTQQASDSLQYISCCNALQPALEGALHHSLLSGSCTLSLQSLATLQQIPQMHCSSPPSIPAPLHLCIIFTPSQCINPTGRAPSRDKLPSPDVAQPGAVGLLQPEPAMHLQIVGHAHVHTIELDLPLLIDAAFCAGAAMITFGAVLGKVSPTQLTWLLTLEVCSILAYLLTGSEGVQLPPASAPGPACITASTADRASTVLCGIHHHTLQYGASPALQPFTNEGKATMCYLIACPSLSSTTTQ